jgi:diguanylate cyclase (GGDEF)-like protein
VDAQAVNNRTKPLPAVFKREHFEQEIPYWFNHDYLTGLPNRTMLQEEFTRMIAKISNCTEKLAVLLLGLDALEGVNFSHGYSIGDKLIQDVSDRLKDFLSEKGLLARFAGDVFVVFMVISNDCGHTSKVMHKLKEQIRTPFQIDGHTISITSSMGISLYPGDGSDLEMLLKKAHKALIQAKRSGRNNFQFYATNKHLILEKQLHRAIEHSEFELYYQPQINLNKQEIAGVEALIRWKHPEKGLIFPGEFIPLAEETGLIVPIGEWVLRTACTQNKLWQDMGITPMRVAVNLSARQFQLPNLVERINKILAETGLEAKYLEVEITESSIMQNIENTARVLKELNETGISVAIDDFGTGYCSLSYLRSFPIHALKIDKSFVQNASSNWKDLAIANAIITLAKSLNLEVVVEGVETEEQLRFFQARGCHKIQGYLFSRPLPADSMTAYIYNFANDHYRFG